MRHIALQMSERAIVRTCLSIDQSSSQALCPRVPTVTIRKTCPCNINPRVTHFYIVKLGHTGVYIVFSYP